MGSWYATCGLSNLPIRDEERVKLILLSPGRGQCESTGSGPLLYGVHRPEGTHYPTDLWEPLVWPITGRYSDYGINRINDIEIAAPPVFLQRLNQVKIEWNDKTLESLFEGELAHRHWMPAKVGHVFVKEDVWEAALDIEINDWRLSTRTLHRASAIQYVSDYVAILKTVDFNDKDSVMDGWRRVFDKLDPDMADLDLFQGWLREAGSSWFHHTVSNMWREGTACEDDFVQAALQIVEMLHLYNVMRHLRKHWTPMSGLGSQTIDYPTHIAFNNAVNRIAQKRLEDDDG